MSATCARHLVLPATFECATCAQSWCANCVTRPPVRGVALIVCPKCDGRGRVARIPPPERVQDFARLLPGAWWYPIRGHGWMALVAGALFYGIVGWAIGMGGYLFIGAALVSGVALGTYLWMFYLSMVTSTIEGHDELPDWPDMAQYADQRILPVLRLLFAIALCLVPAVVGFVLFRPPAMTVLALVVVGLLYLPICILALALGGSIWGLNPIILVPAAVRAGPAYLVACGALFLVLAARWATQATIGHVPILGALTGGLLGSYFLAVQMRVIGLLYRTHERRMRLL